MPGRGSLYVARCVLLAHLAAPSTMQQGQGSLSLWCCCGGMLLPAGLTMVVGPPGTGKTDTAVQILQVRVFGRKRVCRVTTVFCSVVSVNVPSLLDRCSG